MMDRPATAANGMIGGIEDGDAQEIFDWSKKFLKAAGKYFTSALTKGKPVHALASLFLIELRTMETETYRGISLINRFRDLDPKPAVVVLGSGAPQFPYAGHCLCPSGGHCDGFRI